MGFTYILKTNTFLVGHYWDFKQTVNIQIQTCSGFENLIFGNTMSDNFLDNLPKLALTLQNPTFSPHFFVKLIWFSMGHVYHTR